MNSPFNMRFKNMISLIISLICFMNFDSVLGSLKFELSTENPRCFIEELYSGYVLLVKWKVSGVVEEDEQKKNQFLSTVQIFIQREHGGEVLKREYLKTEKGKFSFRSSVDDSYKICVSYHGGWTVPYPVLVGIKLSSENMDHPNLENAIKSEDIAHFSDKTYQILENTKEYIEVQKSEIKREETFAMDHITFSRSFYYVTVFQIIIIVGLGFYQVFNFRKFLKSNSLY